MNEFGTTYTTRFFTPTEKQLEAHNSPETFVLFGGRLGAGKTTWLCAEAIQISLDYPGNVGYLCSKYYDFLIGSKQSTFDKLLGKIECVHHPTENVYLFENGSKIFYGGTNENDRWRIMAMELGWLGIDNVNSITEKEEQHLNEEDIFSMMCYRLQLRYKVYPHKSFPYKVFLTSYPGNGWLKDRFVTHKLSDHAFIDGSISPLKGA